MNAQINIVLVFFFLALGCLSTFFMFFVDRICRSRGDKRISKLSTLGLFFCSGWIGFSGILGVWFKFDFPWWINAIFYFSAIAGSAFALYRLSLFIYLCVRDYRRWSEKNFSARVDEVPVADHPEVVEDNEGFPGAAF
jgi:hypothetical protein